MPFPPAIGARELVESIDPTGLPPYHLAIMAKCDELFKNLEKAYDDYRFNEVASLLYNFLWNDFCDEFLEAVKGDLRDNADSTKREQTLRVFDAVMARYLQALHPYMPHLTEELSARMTYIENGKFLILKKLPKSTLIPKGLAVAALEKANAVFDLASRLRNLKAEYHLAARKDVRFVAKGSPAWLAEEADIICLLAGAQSLDFYDLYEVPRGTPGAVTSVGEFFLPLEGLIDLEAERSRLDKEIAKISHEVTRAQNKLSNEKFVANAKAEIVAIERERLADWKSKLEQIHELRNSIS